MALAYAAKSSSCLVLCSSLFFNITQLCTILGPQHWRHLLIAIARVLIYVLLECLVRAVISLLSC
ncbi:uncharacterized protein K489DRAFT_378973 [Dissoconium aciculare CBS 342.82]|uniref:Uncharacterized protein n=1 Tax=Dissoconium aciculare CBS 342.82 TaxID=1314786 RepID=A0A6J3M957_9PEZI|nr:uncharacterized protein K489DRAFT_378973 [Dissoconium aciculare CBS 342.82]KAF1824545.1 hypothetical protein K489DRAFT_378973 [Dissoconium aciculare CBS 342.82]